VVAKASLSLDYLVGFLRGARIIAIINCLQSTYFYPKMVIPLIVKLAQKMRVSAVKYQNSIATDATMISKHA
jgi:hypothetical protein